MARTGRRPNGGNRIEIPRDDMVKRRAKSSSEARMWSSRTNTEETSFLSAFDIDEVVAVIVEHFAPTVHE